MSFPRVDGLRALEIGTPGHMRQWLNGLILAGQKRATAGLLADYLREDEAIESEGERLRLVDDAGLGIATVEVVRVERCAFAEVPWEFATAEAEGDKSIDEWREGHLGYWTAEGQDIDDETPVVLVWFNLVDETVS